MNEYMGHKTVVIPCKGTNICIKGVWYVVLSTVTYQDEPGEFSTHATLLELDGNAEDAGKDTKSVNLDTVDYTVWTLANPDIPGRIAEVMTLPDMSAYASQKGQGMPNWQNVGVSAPYQSKTDIPTKAALKRLIAETPEKVYVYSTDAFGENAGKSWNADKLEIGVKYSVAGPNPYTSRKWFATIEKTAKGIKVS